MGQGTLGDVNSTHFEPSPSTTPWPDTTFIYTQTFSIDNYVHPATSGEEWFFKVSAVDTDGNETLSDELSFLLDTVPPTAGTFTVENLVDGYLKSLTSFTLSGEGIRYGAVPVAGPRSTELSTPALGHAFTNTLRSSISTSLSLS